MNEGEKKSKIRRDDITAMLLEQQQRSTATVLFLHVSEQNYWLKPLRQRDYRHYTPRTEVGSFSHTIARATQSKGTIPKLSSHSVFRWSFIWCQMEFRVSGGCPFLKVPRNEIGVSWVWFDVSSNSDCSCHENGGCCIDLWRLRLDSPWEASGIFFPLFSAH